MSVSLILIGLLGFLAAMVVMIVGQRLRAVGGRAGVGSAEPACGRCGYCVRGVSELICPECGGDLREVGILAPGMARAGVRKPLGPGGRVLVWTLVIAAPALFLGWLAGEHLAPWTATSTRSRAVFIQSPGFNDVVTVRQEGRLTTVGRPQYNLIVPAQRMTLTLAGVGGAALGTAAATLEVDLATRAARFVDSTGRTNTGTLDAPMVAQWLRANGAGGPSPDPRTLDARAHDVLASADEMTGGGGRGFSRFGYDARGNIPAVTAHPAFAPFPTRHQTPLGTVAPFLVAALVWAAGLPFVLRRRAVHGPSGRTDLTPAVMS